MKKIRTVLGDIAGSNIGMTYTHEHLYCNPYTARKDETLAIKDVDLTISELRDFKKSGGNTIIEATPIDYGRSPEMLKRASLSSGVNIIASTGFYLYDHNPIGLPEMALEQVAGLFEKEIVLGMDDTNIKAGQIKCAVSTLMIHPNEKKVLRAAAIAQKRTNVPIWVHHAGFLGNEVLDELERGGADLTKVVLGHIDRNPDPYVYKKVARRGCCLSVDNLARVYRYPLQANIDVIMDLLDNGYMNNLFVSADFGRHSYYKAYGGGPGLVFILDYFIPRLIEQCKLTQNDIKTIFEVNPKRMYACF